VKPVGPGSSIPDAESPPARGPSHHEGHASAPIDAGKEDRAARGLPIVPAFDGYRAFAILAIVLFHLSAFSGVAAAAERSFGDELIVGIGGWVVNVLFIVSGFVVFLPTVARGGDLGSVSAYALRRGARLLPALWLSLVITLALIAWIPDSSVPVPGLGEVAINFSGLHEIAAMFDTGSQTGFQINGAIWTLTLEISFYIVLPLVASAYFRRPFLGLAIAAAVAIGWRVAFAHVADLASLVGFEPTPERAAWLRLSSQNQLPSWGFSFAAGMTGAWAYVRASQHRDTETVQRYSRAALIVALPPLALFAYLAGHYAATSPHVIAGFLGQRNPIVYLGYTASLATAMVALTLTRGRQLPFAHPLARRLGDISYGVFLIHLVIAWTILTVLSPVHDGSAWSFVVWTLMVVPASLAYGYLSARFLEQPIRRWAHRFGRRAQAVPAPRATAEASSRAL
jgi:peptidoglycan/LPS O-acetylase OafA/YrhL